MLTQICLRNELIFGMFKNFWNVQGIINTSGLLPWVNEHSKNWIYCLYLHFIINIQNIEIIYNLGNKKDLYLIWNCINGFVGV